jgi:hypothetical protein
LLFKQAGIVGEEIHLLTFLVQRITMKLFICRHVAATLCFVSLAAAHSASAQTFTTGYDATTGPGAPRPNSNAAAAAFDLAIAPLGAVGSANLENLALTTNTNLVVTPAISANFINVDTSFNTVVNVDDQSLGYNTTVGGSLFLRLNPLLNAATSSLRLSFTSPVAAAGFYLTGYESGSLGPSLVSYSGVASTYTPTASGLGGVEFIGFTAAPGEFFSDITITWTNPNNTNRDFLGVDDIRFAGGRAVVPENGTLFLIAPVLLCGIGVAMARRYRVTHA